MQQTSFFFKFSFGAIRDNLVQSKANRFEPYLAGFTWDTKEVRG
jgi:hypothetical protein